MPRRPLTWLCTLGLALCIGASAASALAPVENDAPMEALEAARMTYSYAEALEARGKADAGPPALAALFALGLVGLTRERHPA